MPTYPTPTQEERDAVSGVGRIKIPREPERQAPPEPKVVRTRPDLPTQNALAGGFVFDLETTSLDVFEAKIVGIGICTFNGDVYYIPVGHRMYCDDWPFPEPIEPEAQLPLQVVLDYLAPALSSSTIRKLAHNAKYDMGVLAGHGITVNNVDDTMLLYYVLRGPRNLSLDYLVKEHVGGEIKPIKNLIGPHGEMNFSYVPGDVAAQYTGAQVFWTLQLWKAARQHPNYDPNYTRPIYDIEKALLPCLVSMERNGVQIDTQVLSDLGAEIDYDLERISERLFELNAGMVDVQVSHRNYTGEFLEDEDGTMYPVFEDTYETVQEYRPSREFNINSSQQLGEFLFGKLGLPITKKSRDTGAASTDHEALSALEGKHEAVDLILEYKGKAKLKNTYTDTIPLKLRGGRIHTHFNQSVTTTGRLSSSDPNLQNIPIRSKMGARVREAFVAPEGKLLVVSDYSQVELRVLAEMSGENAMIQAFLDGHDFHAATAATLWNYPIDEVPDEKRMIAKNINFGLVYGISAGGLSKRYGLGMQEAQELIDTYFRTFPKVKRFLDEAVMLCKADGYSETYFGRRRYLPDIDNYNRGLRNAAEREAMNMRVQGTAADLIKIAMVRVYENVCGDGTNLLLQVHDELLLEEWDWCAESAAHEVTKIMQGVAPEFSVPLVVDTHIGKNWSEAKG